MCSTAVGVPSWPERREGKTVVINGVFPANVAPRSSTVLQRPHLTPVGHLSTKRNPRPLFKLQPPSPQTHLSPISSPKAKAHANAIRPPHTRQRSSSSVRVASASPSDEGGPLRRPVPDLAQ
ncbi:hypothetical protein CALCODRAFT_370655 [Calocera cornea HHB12733]|uniref:Uncharacterized protein n=1 Tax=Calocera cornea HHB12733 TaxID=1353952 RepID=A0A165EH38_9BASI|nr:hypothetical protein CALCODRAFT_370655 [Calocera cornea HHB12733]